MDPYYHVREKKEEREMEEKDSTKPYLDGFSFLPLPFHKSDTEIWLAFQRRRFG
jgi:hypothetical protein